MNLKENKIIKYLYNYIKKPECYIPLLNCVLFTIIAIPCCVWVGFHTYIGFSRKAYISMMITYYYPFIASVPLLLWWLFYLKIKRNQNLNRVLYTWNTMLYYSIVACLSTLWWEWGIACLIFVNLIYWMLIGTPIWYLALFIWDNIIQLIIKLYKKNVVKHDQPT